MPALDLSDPVLALSALPDALYVHRFPPTAVVPSSLFEHGGWVSVTRTAQELSIVASREDMDLAGFRKPSDQHLGGPWTAFRVRGPLEHHMVGVMSEIARVLKDAEVSIFTISTWDTDYILVTADTFTKAKQALTSAGWKWE